MNDKFKKLTMKLTEILSKTTMIYLDECLDNVETYENVKALLLSSHVSSMIHCMKIITTGDEEEEKKITDFAIELFNAIKSFKSIVKVEIIKNG